MDGTMAPGLSDTMSRPYNARPGDTNTGNFVASNTGLDIPSQYASPRRNSPTYTSFFDPDYFVRPKTPNSCPSPIQSSPLRSSLPSTPSQGPADARWECIEQENGYEFRTRNDCRKMSKKEHGKLSHVDQINLSQEHNNLRYSTSQSNKSQSQVYQAPNSVTPRSPTEQSWASGKSTKISYKRSYVSSHEGQSLSSAPISAKKACQQNVGYASMKSGTARSPLDFGLDSAFEGSHEKKTHAEHVPTTSDQKSTKLHVAAKSCKPTFSSQSVSSWEPFYANYPLGEMVFGVPEHLESDPFTASKATNAPLSSQFPPYQPEASEVFPDKSIQPNQSRARPAQTTPNHPAGAELNDDAFASSALTRTKLSENGLPLINKKDMMIFSSWRNKNKYVVYPGESGTDLEKAWLRSVNDHTGQTPTELDRRRFYAMRSKYPYEMLGELNEVMKPNPLDEIVVDNETYNGQRETPFLGLEQKVSRIFSGVQRLGGLAEQVHEEGRPNPGLPQWGIPVSASVFTAIGSTHPTGNPVSYVDKGSQKEHCSNTISSSSIREKTIGESFRGCLPSDRESTEASACPTSDYSNETAMEKPKTRERHTSSNSNPNSKVEAFPDEYAKPEALKDNKLDIKPGWKPGCSPNFGPNKPGKLFESKCQYCQKFWREAQVWAASRAQHLDLKLNLISLPDSLRSMVLGRLKRHVLLDVENLRWDSIHCHTCADVEPEAYELRVAASQKKGEITESRPLFSCDKRDVYSSWMESKQGSVSNEQEKDQRENSNDKQDANRKSVANKRPHTMKQNALCRMISWVEMRKKAQQSENALLSDQIIKGVFANQVDSSDEVFPGQSLVSVHSSRETKDKEVSVTTHDEDEQTEDAVDQEDVGMENVSDSSEWAKAEQGSVSSEDEEYQIAEVNSGQDMDMENASDSSEWTRTSQWLVASEDEDFEII